MVRIYGARGAAGRRVRKGDEALGGEGARLALQHGADHAGLRYSCWREPSTERAGTRNIGYGIGMSNAGSGGRAPWGQGFTFAGLPCSSNSGDSVQQLTSSMRRRRTLARFIV